MTQLIRRSLAILAAAFAVALLLPLGPAYAQDEAVPLADDTSQFIIAAPMWSIIVGLILPFVVGAITKASADDRFQAVVGILVAAAGAIVVRATTVDGAAVFDQALFLDIALVYGPQLLSYLGVYKAFQLNQKLAPNVGLG